MSLARLWPWFAGAGGVLVVLILIVTVMVVAAGSRSGVVAVTIDPPGVEILVDGRPVPRDLVVNKDVVRLDVAAGKHEMRVTKDGYEPYTVQFNVASGETEDLRVRLEPKKDRVAVTKNPQSNPNQNPKPSDPPDDSNLAKRDRAVAPFKTITIANAGNQSVAAADSKHFASRQDNGVVRYWDASNPRKPLAEFNLQGDGPGRVAISADGKKLVAFNQNNVKVWELDTDRESASSKANPGVNVIGITFTDEDRILTTLCVEAAPLTGLIQFFDLETKKEVVRLVGHTASVKWALLSPDRTRAISSGEDKVLRVWDARDGRGLFHLPAPDRPAKCMALSPDGKRALTSHYNSEVNVWDLVNGTEIRVLKGSDGHFGEVDAVAFTPDGRLALSGGVDSIIRVWDLRTGKIAGRLKGDSSIVSLAVSPSGDAVFAGTFGGKVLCFRMPKDW